MRVLVPSPLRSYTNGRPEVEGSGATLAELIESLNAAFPGIRFRMVDEQERIRQHIRIFVNREQARELNHRLADGDEVQILCALSGG
jgi:molybdopterin converting factor small subunit